MVQNGRERQATEALGERLLHYWRIRPLILLIIMSELNMHDAFSEGKHSTRDPEKNIKSLRLKLRFRLRLK